MSTSGAVLLTTKDAKTKTIAPFPVQMKTPTGFSFMGFSSQEVGSYYLRHLGASEAHHAFVSAREFFSGAPPEGRKMSKIVFFRNEQDVDIHLRDRENFPYQDYELSVEETEKEG
jgi:hypothetical protein